jgi:chitodextrinase
MFDHGWKRPSWRRLAAVCSALAALAIVPAHAQAGGLSVKCRSGVLAPSDNQIAPFMMIVNGGTTAVAMNTLTVRYWYTADTSATQNYTCDWAVRGCSNISARFGTLNPAATNADTFLELSFGSGAGTLGAGADTGDIQGRIWKTDWSNFNETNDYSYPASAAYADCSKVALYQGGTLVWGTPAGGSTGPDTTPPSTPTNLAASAVSSTALTLSWTASTDDVGVAGYNVYSGSTLVTTAAASPVTLSSLTPNTTYSFTLKAKDGAGNLSAATAALNVTTLALDTTPPSAPTSLTASSITSSSAVVSWTASTDNVAVTGYDVYNGTALFTSVTTTSATLSGLAPKTSYSITVKARDAAGNASSASAALAVTTLEGTTRQQGAYPTPPAGSCGGWALVDGVCVPQYCSDNLQSEDCSGCGGPGSAKCQKVSSKAGMSGVWPEVHSVSTSEPWHFSRSTHFGLTNGGACGFGYYGLCNNKTNWTDPSLAANCKAFCTAYPALCTDPANISLRGNFAAPPGNYYTQFWPSLPGDRDNYLACGECFEVIRTKPDGTDYATGEIGYNPSIVLQTIDSCPCSANSKWCCGSGRDHCAEISGPTGFKYGCQLPPAAPYTTTIDQTTRDPLPNESIHLDLSDIAMARLQSGSANGGMVDGVIPIRYKRVPCPVVGNVYIWLRSGASPYYFSLSVVNMAGLGSATMVDAMDAAGNWIAMVRDQNYTTARPQERYGSWVIPQGSGPFNLPVSLRITDGSGVPRVATNVIKSWTPASSSMNEMYYIDTGLQF